MLIIHILILQTKYTRFVIEIKSKYTVLIIFLLKHSSLVNNIQYKKHGTLNLTVDTHAINNTSIN